MITEFHQNVAISFLFMLLGVCRAISRDPVAAD